MGNAIDRAKQIALALGRKHVLYSFKAKETEGRISFIELEIWRNEDKQYIGSDLRSEAFYNELDSESAKKLIDSVGNIIQIMGTKHATAPAKERYSR